MAPTAMLRRETFMPSRSPILLSVVALIAISPAAAQAQRPLGPDPSRRTPKQDYVPVSAEADGKLALAQRMGRLKEWAKAAGFRLVELYLENGEFAAAAWLGERLLANHPGIGDDRARLLFRTALAEHLDGDDDAAKRNRDQIAAGATGVVRGRDVVLADE